ncbi:hypothetical protein FOL47_010147, partial [Perkinsus chesapeaki]
NVIGNVDVYIIISLISDFAVIRREYEKRRKYQPVLQERDRGAIKNPINYSSNLHRPGSRAKQKRCSTKVTTEGDRNDMTVYGGDDAAGDSEMRIMENEGENVMKGDVLACADFAKQAERVRRIMKWSSNANKKITATIAAEYTHR